MDTDRQPGISFDAVFLKEAEIREVEDSSDTPEQAGGLSVSLSATSRVFGEDRERGELVLTVNVTPDASVPAFHVRVVLAGVFSYQDPSDINLRLTDFLEDQAPALILPFAREIIANLTARTIFGPVLLPPVNVHALLTEAAEEPEGVEAEEKQP